MPYFSIKIIKLPKDGGNKGNKTFEPSSGGIGIKLKTASKIL